MLKKAPLTFCIGFVALAVMIYFAEYTFIFKEQLALKDNVITTLKEKISAKQPAAPTTAPPANRSATTSGDNSPANTGDGNTFGSPPKIDHKQPKKR